MEVMSLLRMQWNVVRVVAGDSVYAHSSQAMHVGARGLDLHVTDDGIESEP